MKGITTKFWFPWVLVVLGHLVTIGGKSSFTSNGVLKSCSWIDFGSIGFAIAAALVAGRMLAVPGKPDNVPIWQKAVTAAAILAAVHLFFNGLGLVGPSPCKAG